MKLIEIDDMTQHEWDRPYYVEHPTQCKDATDAFAATKALDTGEVITVGAVIARVVESKGGEA